MGKNPDSLPLSTSKFEAEVSRYRALNETCSPVHRSQSLPSIRTLWSAASRRVRRSLFRGLFLRVNQSMIDRTPLRRTHFCNSPRDLSWANAELQRWRSSGILTPFLKKETPLIHPWFVVWKRGKPRLVIDFLRLNSAISESPSVQYQDLRSLPPLVKKGNFMFSIDIKSAFHHIPLSQSLQTLSCISWQGQVFALTVMSFGLNMAPRIWCQVLEFPLSILRAEGVILSSYMDDILGIAPTRTQARQSILRCLEVLTSFGFVLSWEKSVLAPTREIQHLGFTINSRLLSFSIPPAKLSDIRNFCFSAATRPHLRLRTVQSLLGKILAVSVAFLPARRFTWSIIQELSGKTQGPKARRRDPKEKIFLSLEARQDLAWIHQALRQGASRRFSSRPLVRLYTDSSMRGWGAWSPDLGMATSGHWLPSVRVPHIQELELEAVNLAISVLPFPRHSDLHLFIDNIAAKAYIEKWGGSASPELRRLSHRLWDTTVRKDLCIFRVSYIPSKDNAVADRLSRLAPPPSLHEISPPRH